MMLRGSADPDSACHFQQQTEDIRKGAHRVPGSLRVFKPSNPGVWNAVNHFSTRTCSATMPDFETSLDPMLGKRFAPMAGVKPSVSMLPGASTAVWRFAFLEFAPSETKDWNGTDGSRHAAQSEENHSHSNVRTLEYRFLSERNQSISTNDPERWHLCVDCNAARTNRKF